VTTRRYSVTIDRHTLDTYVVTARNSTEAGMIAAQSIADNIPPTYSSEKSRRILGAKPIIEEDGPVQQELQPLIEVTASKKKS
jgi:hypothetical protein